MAMLHTEKTSTGLDANLAAALSYLVGFVTGIIFLLVEKENKFVRFHAMQSTLLFAGIVAVDILLQLVPILGALVVVFVVIPVSAAKRPRFVPSAATCAGVVPGRIRAIASNIVSRLFDAGATWKGSHNFTVRSGYPVESGNTATMV